MYFRGVYTLPLKVWRFYLSNASLRGAIPHLTRSLDKVFIERGVVETGRKEGVVWP